MAETRSPVLVGPAKQISALPRAMAARVRVTEIGVVQAGLASSGIALIAGEFPLVGGSGFVPRLSKRKLPKGADAGSRRIGFRAVGEMIWMMISGCAPGDGSEQLRLIWAWMLVYIPPMVGNPKPEEQQRFRLDLGGRS